MRRTRYFSRLGVLLFPLLFAVPYSGVGQISQHPKIVNSIDSLLERPTHVRAMARVEDETGTARAIYAPRPVQLQAGTDDERARKVLRADKRIGWIGRDDDLRLIKEHRSRGGSHLTYQQYVDDVPVLGRYTRVSFDRRGNPTFVVNGFAPHLENQTDLDTTPRIPKRSAQIIADGVFTSGVTRLGETELFIVANTEPRLVWRTFAWPESGGEFEIYVDAGTGELVAVRDLTLHRSPGARRHAHRDGAPGLSIHTPFETGAAQVSGTMVDGMGLVFDPDPLASAGKSYAPPYVDSDDEEIAELNAERVLVDLPGITLGPDQLHRLVGPHVEVTGRRSNGQVNYNPPEELNANGFVYTRGDERFESVMVYHHIDKSQRYVQSLGFDDVQNYPLPVNPFGEGNADVSNYYLNLRYLALGGGGVDDAEDAFVIWHEYAHALLDSQVPGLANNFDGTALHEGWSDYWAASYQREMFEDGQLPSGDWKQFFRWDGNNPQINWFGRYLPDFRMYPTDLTKTSVHQDGLVWASAMMAVYDRLGRHLTDERNLQSHYYLSAPATMADAAHAIIQADLDLYGGEHAGDLVSVLGQRGFVDASEFRTVVEHEPLPDTEQLGGTVSVSVEVTPILSQVQSVTVVYSGLNPGTVAMTSDDGMFYTGVMPLPDTPSVVTYYIEAVDEQNQITRLPEGAPDTQFAFVAGPDSEAPQIEHTQLEQQSIFGWPPMLEAEVDDNIAVDTVFVEFTISSRETSTVLAESSFGLDGAETLYIGTFPEVVLDLSGRELDLTGSERVAYRIFAIDASSSSNQAVLPDEQAPAFQFDLAVSGTVEQFSFEADEPGVIATGSWERGTPSFGLTFAHSGSSAWATDLDGAYPATQETASLILPAVDLKELESAWLVFWHWYDVEHDGTAEPGTGVEATLWDGGNVSVSVDDGASWQLVTPEGGYDGVISSGGGNPKEGEPAFGGYSHGWRRELVEIPGGQSVSIRFDFGTDVSNAESSLDFIGWLIDDVAIEVDRPIDNEAPVLLDAPPAVTEVAAGATPAPASVSLGLTDNVGIERVVAAYDITGPQGAASGNVRFSMSLGSPTQFSGVIPIETSMAVAGTSIEYRIIVRDFDGNELVLPGDNQRYRFSYILVEETDLTSEATPSGGWLARPSGWYIDSDTHLGSGAALVFQPVDLPVDATSIGFEVTHSFRLQSGAGGRLAVSAGGGSDWEVIDPDNGYPNNSSFFVGIAPDVTSIYSLDDMAGRHVWIRLEMIAEQPLSATDFWSVSAARLVYKGSSSELEVPRSLELHPNYPNPFSISTTISYAIPTAADALIEVFDVLGRRVETLRDGPHREGSYTIHWQPDLVPGVYFVRLTTNGAGRSIRVTRVR